MSFKKKFTRMSAWATLACCSAAWGQMNMAALAQFKQNQQQALARQLQNSAPAAPKNAKTKHVKGEVEAPSVIAKPALIKAQNRSFKGNFSDMRRSNMR